MRMRRADFVASTGFGLLITLTQTALASTQDEKRKFIAQCDESISIDRLAGAPYKFLGKKVDLHGVVGPATDPHIINLNSVNSFGTFVIVIADSRNFEQGQRIRVLGTVEKPISGENNMGGNGTYAVVRKAYIE